MMKSHKPTPTPPGLPLSGEEARFPPDGTTSHSTRLSKDDSQVAGYDKGGLRGVGFIPYDKRHTPLARENRNNPTAAESKMWNEVLRMRHFEKLKFLRQKPIAKYIVDFYCAELRLAIEIDGDSHADAAAYDVARTSALDARGITVVRYTNDEIMNNLEGVYDDLVRRVALINDGAERP